MWRQKSVSDICATRTRRQTLEKVRQLFTIFQHHALRHKTVHPADTEFADQNTPFVLPSNALNLRQTQCRTHRYKTLTCTSTLAAPKQRLKFLIRSVLNKFRNDSNLPQQILHKPTRRERLCEKLSRFCCWEVGFDGLWDACAETSMRLYTFMHTLNWNFSLKLYVASTNSLTAKG